ncbi:MAG: multicopper oxidase domain-containing protein, partial [Acidobacteriota bacterium]
MIDRREFVRSVTAAAAGGIVWACSDGVAQSAPRSRAVARGRTVFRSAGSRLTADLQPSETEVMLGGQRTRLFAFNGSVPGPMFEARAGDDVTIRLANALDEATNLHFHGLHTPPNGAADNIFLHIESGEVFTYQFTIPSNHQAGLFWVHPHMHGTVARQVSRGLASPFVIRGEIDAVPEVAAADEHILVLQDFEVGSRGTIVEPSMPDLVHGREGSIITAGGAINPTLPIRQNGLLRLRLVNASVSRFYRLKLEEHPLHLIGVDGGALGAVRTEEEILLVPGARLDILIEGRRAEGTFRLLNLPYDRGGTGMMGGMGGSRPETVAPQTLATIEYRGRADKAWTIPGSLVRPVESLPPATTPPRAFQLGQGMMMGRGMSFTINGRGFDANRI